MSVVDVDEIGSEWDFTLSDQTATPAAGCPLNPEGTFPTLLTQEGNAFTSESFLTYTGIVNGNSYSLAYRDPDFGGGGVTYIDIHTTQYSDEPVALFGSRCLVGDKIKPVPYAAALTILNIHHALILIQSLSLARLFPKMSAM